MEIAAWPTELQQFVFIYNNDFTPQNLVFQFTKDYFQL